VSENSLNLSGHLGQPNDVAPAVTFPSTMAARTIGRTYPVTGSSYVDR
jgi:hypothetical protein